MKKKKQQLIVFGGYSGAGKTSIVECLLKYFRSRFERVITTTTRLPRRGERNGVDYIFLSDADFTEKVANGEFLEYATVYGYRYGTLKQSADRVLRIDKNAILNVDLQGYLSLKRSGIIAEMLSFFIIVPTLDILEERLRQRAKIDGTPDEVIRRRLSDAKLMQPQIVLYDHAIVNIELGKAVLEVLDIIEIAGKS